MPRRPVRRLVAAAEVAAAGGDGAAAGGDGTGPAGAAGAVARLGLPRRRVGRSRAEPARRLAYNNIRARRERAIRAQAHGRRARRLPREALRRRAVLQILVDGSMRIKLALERGHASHAPTASSGGAYGRRRPARLRVRRSAVSGAASRCAPAPEFKKPEPVPTPQRLGRTLATTPGRAT